MQLDRNLLKDNGWGFGRCFSQASAEALCDRIPKDHIVDTNFFISISHDCSVISPSLDAEPYLEYLSAKAIDREHGHFINARNIRRLHISIEVDGEASWFEVSMAMRGFVSREGIETCTPDGRIGLPHDSLVILKRWLANRYVAQTFPDKFNEIMEPLVKNSKAKLTKLLSTEIGKACNSIFVSISPDDVDIADDNSYELTLALMFRDEIAEDIGRDAMESFGKEVEKLLESTEGLGPIDVHALAESDATYAQIVKMCRWQFDYLSLQDNSEILVVDHS